MLTRRTSLRAALVLAAVAGGLGTWSATGADPGPAAAVFAEDGLAIRGWDPVAYFRESRPVEGSAEHTSSYRGATWRFASAEHKAAFDEDPARYEPRYGGHCAWTVSQGYTAEIDPLAWHVVDGGLYLNYSKDVQMTWERDLAGNIAKGDVNWPALRGTGDEAS